MQILSRKQLGDWLLEQISKKQYRLIYTAKENKAMSMTGSAVTSDFDIEFTFALKRIHLNHWTSTIGTASNDALHLVLTRPVVHGVPHFVDEFYEKRSIFDSSFIISFEDLGDEGGMVFESSVIRVSLDTTSTDLVQPIIYIKRLD